MWKLVIESVILAIERTPEFYSDLHLPDLVPDGTLKIV